MKIVFLKISDKIFYSDFLEATNPLRFCDFYNAEQEKAEYLVEKKKWQEIAERISGNGIKCELLPRKSVEVAEVVSENTYPLTVLDGNVVLVKHGSKYGIHEIAAMGEQIQGCFPDKKILFLSDDVDIQVI
jgi:hypothetical protein